jgi:hypothetical protein
MGHVGNLLLCVVDGSDDRGGELLEVVGELVLLWCGLTGLLTALGLCGNATIGIQTAQRTVAVVEDTRSFLDERLDVVNKLLLVELVTGCAVGLLDVLNGC